MSEAMWIELIKVLPAFLWIGFGFIALAVARRLLTAQAPRMTRVETPWVTVELAQQAIAAAHRGAVERAAPPIEGPWAAPYPALNAQPIPVSAPPQEPRYPAADGFGGRPPTQRDAEPTGDLGRWDLDSAEREFTTRPPVAATSEPDALATPPADEPADSTIAIKRPDDRPFHGATPNDGAPNERGAHDSALNDRALNDRALQPLTEPHAQVPHVPPTYPGPASYYPPPGQAQHPYVPSVPLPPYPPSVYQPGQADSGQGLRAATKLALSADLLQGGAILWVDDHHEWNEPLIRLFRTAGITVDAVASTPRAMLALKERHYDLVITDMRRLNEAEGANAGFNLLDQMIAAGVPTPAIFFSDNQTAKSRPHPRAVIATSNPEELVDTVVDLVANRRGRTHQSGWLDRLRGGH